MSMSGAIHFKRSAKLAVAPQNLGHFPVINDVSWNPSPQDCPGQRTDCIIASASTEGTSVFKLVPGNKEQCRWMAYGEDRFFKMYDSPPSEGETAVLKFHPRDGRVLLTGSRSGLLSLLVFSNNTTLFGPVDQHQCDGAITSLDWCPKGRYFVAGLSTSRVMFFRLVTTDNFKTLKLDFQGLANFTEELVDDKVFALFHPNSNWLYTCSQKSDSIMIWLLSESTWRIVHKVQCGMGVLGLSMSKFTNPELTDKMFLAALHDNDTCEFWECKENSSLVPMLKARGVKSLGNATIKHSGGAPAGSCATAMDIGPYIITCGVNENSSMSTIVASDLEFEGHSAPEFRNSCAMKTFQGNAKKMNCIKFNPSQQGMAMLSFVTGGDKGFLHFWAISRMPQLFRTLSSIEEEYYYRGGVRGRTNVQKYEKLVPGLMNNDNYNGPGSGIGRANNFRHIAKGATVKIEDNQDVPVQADDEGSESSESDNSHVPSMAEEFRRIKAAQAQEVQKVRDFCSNLKSEISERITSFEEKITTKMQDNPYEDLCEQACNKVDELTGQGQN